LGAGGKTLALLIHEMTDFCHSCKGDEQLTAHAAQLATLSQEWQELSLHIAHQAQTDPDQIGAAAVDYLMYSGYLVLAFLWLNAQKTALQQLATSVADPGFYRAKLATAEFYFARILPRTISLVQAMKSGSGNLMNLASDDF
jgi:hypothetical protein